MRKVRLFGYLIALILLFIFSACKKEFDTDRSNDGKINTAVRSWLQVQSSLYSNSASNITQLGDALLVHQMNISPLNDSTDIILIPISKELARKKGIAHNYSLCLMLFYKKSQSITTGGIISFISSNDLESIRLSSTQLCSILNGKKSAFNGEINFMSVTGRWLSRMKIANGELISTGNVISLNNARDNRTNNLCIDWYLVTTYYFADGTTETTSEYLGTTCYEDCGNGSYMILCPDGGGGGGNNVNTNPLEQHITINGEADSYIEQDNGILDPNDANETPQRFPVIFSVVATTYSDPETRHIINITVSPMTAYPSNISYTDIYQRRVRRTVTPYGTVPNWQRLTPTTAYVTASASVYWLWIYIDGSSPTYNRTTTERVAQVVSS